MCISGDSEGWKETGGGAAGRAWKGGGWMGDGWNVGRMPEGSWEESITAQTLGQVLNSIPGADLQSSLWLWAAPGLFSCVTPSLEGAVYWGGWVQRVAQGQLSIFHQHG